jgi:hypothetical protein
VNALKTIGPFFEETNSDPSNELIPTPLLRELTENGNVGQYIFFVKKTGSSRR